MFPTERKEKSFDVKLWIIVLCQFAAGTLWFSANGVMDSLVVEWGIAASAIAHATSAVQFGFVIGTLLFALFAIADYFSPRRVFFLSAFFGATFNAALLLVGESMMSLLILRFFTGFFLAGIYPVGMKIAAGYYKKGLGRALGFLVGALAFGTAFPHLLQYAAVDINWKLVIMGTSILALVGGSCMLLLVPDGPYIQKTDNFTFSGVLTIFKVRKVRAAALGYFGHMWELYAMWAFIPLFINENMRLTGSGQGEISLWTFFVIAAGMVGCVVGGLLAQNKGSARIACLFLFGSALCCLLSPFILSASKLVFLGFILLWGFLVAGDSPQYSVVVARNAPGDLVGSSLTMINCIGFSVTIISIQMIDMLIGAVGLEFVFLLLAPGPILGVCALLTLLPDENR